MKYRFIYQVLEVNDSLVEYDTDVEPPHVGDFVHLNTITEDKIEDVFVVTNIYYSPQSPHKTIIFIEIEKFDLVKVNHIKKVG